MREIKDPKAWRNYLFETVSIIHEGINHLWSSSNLFAQILMPGMIFCPLFAWLPVHYTCVSTCLCAVCHSYSYLDIVENLPGPPQSLSLQAVNETSITISWNPPTENADNVKYVLFYNKDSQQQYTYIEVRLRCISNLMHGTRSTQIITRISK